MRRGTSSKKLNTAFNLYGVPTIHILCECGVEELDTFEVETIQIYDSINNGFNTLKEPGNRLDLQGELHGRSKHSNEEVLLAFHALLNNPTCTFNQVSKITGVGYSTVKHIAAGTSHTWLKEKFPEEYLKLVSILGSRMKTAKTAKVSGIILPKIISPLGQVFEVDNINGFAREHSLDVSALHRVLHRKAKTHKGWKLE